MSRLFDGVDDQMVYAGSPLLTGAYTLLVVVEIVVTADNTWLSFIENEDTSGGGPRVALGRKNNGNLYCSNSVANTDAVTATDADAWAVYAVTKAAGTVVPRFHKCLLGSTSNTHTNGAGTLVNDAGAAWTLRIGGNDDFANIKVAAAAEWAGTALSDGQIEGIASAKTTAAIAALSPTWLVDDSDALATDLIGSVDRTAITGTADDADDPAGWVYGLGGAPTTSRPFVRRRAARGVAASGLDSGRGF